MSEYKVVGQRVPRVDGPDKATGRCLFSADIKLPGMLTGKILYSSRPHARIVSIDTGRAERLRTADMVPVAGRVVPVTSCYQFESNGDLTRLRSGAHLTPGVPRVASVS